MVCPLESARTLYCLLSEAFGKWRLLLGKRSWRVIYSRAMRASSLILAHDLGTTGNKATLFDAQGSLVSSAFAGYATVYPQPNWAEQNADDWWRATVVATQQLLAQSGTDAAAIAAVSFSGQMM